MWPNHTITSITRIHDVIVGGHKTSTIQKFRLIIVHTITNGMIYHRPQMVLVMVTKRFPKVVTAQRDFISGSIYVTFLNVFHTSFHDFGVFSHVFPTIFMGSQVTRCH